MSSIQYKIVFDRKESIEPWNAKIVTVRFLKTPQG
jgi:hypothetical protein